MGHFDILVKFINIDNDWKVTIIALYWFLHKAMISIKSVAVYIIKFNFTYVVKKSHLFCLTVWFSLGYECDWEQIYYTVQKYEYSKSISSIVNS